MQKAVQHIGVAVGVCLFMGFVSGFAVHVGADDWYQSLTKPEVTPSDNLFAPVWLLIYLTMGIAAGLVWSRGMYHIWVKTALYHFVFQLLLNVLWNLVFFGLHNPFWGLMTIISLSILVAVTIRWFRVVDKKAAWLLAPYLVWTLFLAYVNFKIWQLN